MSRYEAMVLDWSPSQIKVAKNFHEELYRNLLAMYEVVKAHKDRSDQKKLSKARGFFRKVMSGRKSSDSELIQLVKKIIKATPRQSAKSDTQNKPIVPTMRFNYGHKGWGPKFVMPGATFESEFGIEPELTPDDNRIKRLEKLCGSDSKQPLNKLIEALTRMFVCAWEFAINRTIPSDDERAKFAKICAHRALKFVLSDKKKNITLHNLFEGIIKCEGSGTNQNFDEDSKVEGHYTMKGICQHAPFVTPDGSNGASGTFYIPQQALVGIGREYRLPKSQEWNDVKVNEITNDTQRIELDRVKTKYPPIQISEEMRGNIGREKEVEFRPLPEIEALFRRWFVSGRRLMLIGVEQVKEYIREMSVAESPSSLNDWLSKKVGESNSEEDGSSRSSSHRVQAVYHGRIGGRDEETIDLQCCSFAGSDLSRVRITNATPPKSCQGAFLYQAKISVQPQQSMETNFSGATMTGSKIEIIRGNENCRLELNLSEAKTEQLAVSVNETSIRLHGQPDGKIQTTDPLLQQQVAEIERMQQVIIAQNLQSARERSIRVTGAKALIVLTLAVALTELLQSSSKPDPQLKWGALLLAYCVAAIVICCVEKQSASTHERDLGVQPR